MYMQSGSVRISMELPGFVGRWTVELTSGVIVLTGINNAGKSRTLQLIMQLKTMWHNETPLDSLGPISLHSELDGVNESLTVTPDDLERSVQYRRWHGDIIQNDVAAARENNSWAVRDASTGGGIGYCVPVNHIGPLHFPALKHG